jgi:hypothetical protein
VNSVAGVFAWYLVAGDQYIMVCDLINP